MLAMKLPAEARELRLALSRLPRSEVLWRDALTDRHIRAEGDMLRVPLGAYEIIWLEPARA